MKLKLEHTGARITRLFGCNRKMLRTAILDLIFFCIFLAKVNPSLPPNKKPCLMSTVTHQKPYAQWVKQGLGTQSHWARRCCCSGRHKPHQKRDHASRTPSGTNWHLQCQQRTPQTGSPLQSWIW